VGIERRAFLVLGPESSGTRLWTRILMMCGCYGDGGHSQRLDSLALPDEPLLVWRRSLPHAKQWPNVQAMARKLREGRYTVHALVCMRDWWALLRSQVRNGHVESVEDAATNAQEAYRRIFAGLGKASTSYTVCSYESLAQRGAVMIGKLLPSWELTPPDHWAEEFFDGNEKHYRSTW